MSAVNPEVALAAAYALLLLAIAGGLELLARHSHRRSERYRTAGFRFHPHLDTWECPEGEHLRRVEHHAEHRLVRYRARAHVCNACGFKDACTDSDDGREIVRAIDPWPHSDVGRFHRGVSVVLAALAVFVLAVVLARRHAPAELLVLLPALALAGLAAAWLARGFRAARSNFDAVAGGPPRGEPRG